MGFADPKLPQGYLMSPQELFVFDHSKRTVAAVVNLDLTSLSPLELPAAFKVAKARTGELLAQIQKPFTPTAVRQVELPFTSTTEETKFLEGIELIQKEIAKGEVRQVVLSQRLVAPKMAEPLASYRQLRSQNPSPYLFWLHYPELDLVGASPESLVSFDGMRAQLRPIAAPVLPCGDSREDKRRAPKVTARSQRAGRAQDALRIG